MQEPRFKMYKIFLIILGMYFLFFMLSVAVSGFLVQMNSRPAYMRQGYLMLTAVSIAFHTVFVYFAMNKLYLLLTLKKRFVQFLPVLAIMAAAYITYLFLSDKLVAGTAESFNKKLTPGVIIISYIANLTFFCGIMFVITYIFYLVDAKKQRNILEKQKTVLEIEKANANLNFLKAQINPHFLHNTLNYLYAKSIPYSTELSEGILTLSEIMRYALSDNLSKDGKALLKDEIEHVRNVIRINQLRFSNNLQVNFNVSGVINGTTIIPFVLITIVENAFKHGDVKNLAHPIDIQLTIGKQQLVFYCRNKKKTGPKEISTGIGLDNIKKRLELAYGRDYVLDIRDEQDFYTTRLTIHAL